jgi:hypothetical protein
LLIAAGRSARAAVAAALSMAIAGVALTIGFLTPIVSVLRCLGGVAILLAYIPPTPLLLFDSRMEPCGLLSTSSSRGVLFNR